MSLVAWRTLDDLRDATDSLRRARFSVVVKNMRGAVETSLDLGLRLEEVRGAQQLMERAAATDPAILSVEVYDPAGRVVFGTDRSFVGELIPQGWMDAWQAAGTGQWHRAEEDALVAGASLVSSFGAVIGGIALRFTHSTDQGLDDLTRLLAIATLAAGLVAGALAGAAATLVYGPLNRQVRRLAEGADAAGATAALPELESRWHDFAGAAKRAQQEIDDIRQSARALNERD